MRKILKDIFIKLFLILYQLLKIKYLLKIFHINIIRRTKIINTRMNGIISIENDTKIKDSYLLGKININNNTIIENTFFEGKIEIGVNAKINNSNIKGIIQIGNETYIENANISGNIIIGNNSKITEKDVILNGNIEIGNYTSLNGSNLDVYTYINKVKIGNFCSIARNVSIQEYNHKTNRVSSYFMSSNIFNASMLDDIITKGDIIIENDVWIGTQCVILSGSHISTGAVIATNSVVTGYIPPYAIAGGNPAKIIKFRFSESEIKELLNLRWWNWDIDKIKRNKEFFLSESVEINKIIE